MFRHTRDPQPRSEPPAARTVRVLRNPEELAEASARAAEHARRLHDRLEARAARDARTEEHQAGRRLDWRCVAHGTVAAGEPNELEGSDAHTPAA